jgi:hypothetical protein
MADLAAQVKTFLEAEGYAVSPRREVFFGSRRTHSDETEYTYVWVPDGYDPKRFSSRESGFLTRFDEASGSNPGASKFMVLPTLEGLSRQFREGVLGWYRVNIRTPVQFFDTDFKWDISPDAPSEAKKLRDKGLDEGRKRVMQPYTREDAKESGEDLLDTLRNRMIRHGDREKSIHVVIGPAGIGKSYLFDVLFAELHAAFMSHKTRGGPYAPRPLALLPELIPMADARTVRSLLAVYLQTDFARPLKRETFEWSLCNGLAVWMLDGLDELIAQDPSFFDYLLELQTLPNAPYKPKVLVCIRDALLSSHGAFREFLEEYHVQTAIYRLSRWEFPSKRQFAEITLKNSSPEFMSILSNKPSLNELASIPYYCDLLTQRFRDGQLRDEYSEVSLLEDALFSSIQRDYDKGFVDKAFIKPEDVVAFYEAAVSEDFGHGFEGVSIENAMDWARIILPTELEEKERDRLSSQMLNLALFSRGSPGYIRFSQDILENYLLGRRLISLFRDTAHGDVLVRELAHRELRSDWLTVRMTAKQIEEASQFGNLKSLLFRAIAYPLAFKNLLKIALSCPNPPEALSDIPYERQDLSGLVFNGLELQAVSFGGCNLTDVEFRKCNLKGAIFDGAIIRNTAFLSIPPGGLRGADVGDLSTFFSMRVDRKGIVEKHSDARRWFQQQTEGQVVVVEPCPAALQLRCLFNKFVYADGTFRRSWLQRRAMESGKRFHPRPEEVLDAAIRHGYFQVEERFRGRIHRPDGQLYNELVGFATKLRLTPGIKAALDDVCDTESCSHVPAIH